MSYTATVHRLDKIAGEWAAYKTVTAETRSEAISKVCRLLPIGYGGHGRTERVIQAIMSGSTISTPLGTYRLEVEDLPELAPEVSR